MPRLGIHCGVCSNHIAKLMPRQITEATIKISGIPKETKSPLLSVILKVRNPPISNRIIPIPNQKAYETTIGIIFEK